MIYWIEHAPNPWVRAIAIVIIGTIAYFEYTAGENMGPWLGGYGACNDDPYDNTTPEFAASKKRKSRDKNVNLIRSLFRTLGPVGGTVAFQSAVEAQHGKKFSDAEMVRLMKKAFPAPPKTKK